MRSQDESISAYLFMLTLGILFLLIKEHRGIKGIEIFEHCFLYIAYAVDTMLFLKDSQSIAYLAEPFNNFSVFSGLKLSLRNAKKRE